MTYRFSMRFGSLLCGAMLLSTLFGCTTTPEKVKWGQESASGLRAGISWAPAQDAKEPNTAALTLHLKNTGSQSVTAPQFERLFVYRYGGRYSPWLLVSNIPPGQTTRASERVFPVDSLAQTSAAPIAPGQTWTHQVILPLQQFNVLTRVTVAVGFSYRDPSVDSAEPLDVKHAGPGEVRSPTITVESQ